MGRVCRILLVLVCMCLVASGAQAQAGPKEAALALLNAGEFKAAVGAFKALPDDGESRNYMLYASARDFEHGGYFEQAGALYGMLPGFLDSDARLAAQVIDDRMYAYQQAAKLEAEGDIQGAGEAFGALEDYMDSRQRAAALSGTGLPTDPAEIYALAEQCELQGDHLAAYEHFSLIPAYQDAPVRAMRARIRWQELTYQDAENAEAAGDAQRAMALFASLEDYRDSAARSQALQRDEEADAPTASAPLLYPYFDRDIGKTGYMNAAGETVLTPQWDDGGPFYDGLAWVYDDRTGMYSYMGPDGEMAFDGRFMYASDFSEGTAVVYLHNASAVIDTNGDIVIGGLDSASETTSEGMRVIEYGGLCGFAGSKGRYIEPQWMHTTGFSEGLAMVVSEKPDGRYTGYINLDGELVIPCELLSGSDFLGGLAYVVFEDPVNPDGRGGYIDTTGAEVMPSTLPVGAMGNGFSDGLSMCYDDGYYYYINRDGDVAIPGPFRNAHHFKNGRAVVTDDNLQTRLIDTQGDARSDDYDFITNFSEGLASVERDGRCGFIDESGALVIPLAYLGASPFRGELAEMDEGDELLYIDRSNQVVRRWIKRDLTPPDSEQDVQDYLDAYGALPDFVDEGDSEEVDTSEEAVDDIMFVADGKYYFQFNFDTLKMGDAGDLVKAAQRRLIALGFLYDSADGEYGGNTRNAVNDFQDWNGLACTGQLDFYSMSALMSKDAEPYVEDEFCVQLASYARWEMSGTDKMHFQVQVTNRSRHRTVKSVRLYYKCLGSDGYSVGEVLYTKELDVKIGPGRTVYVPNVTFSKRKKIRKMECKIGWVTFSDGSCAYAPSDAGYFSWDIGW